MTMVKPVKVQTMMVSRKVPVMATRACRPGWSVLAAAAAMGADPSPDSLEKSPRATPILITVPMAPPAMA